MQGGDVSTAQWQCSRTRPVLVLTWHELVLPIFDVQPLRKMQFFPP